MTAGEPNPGTAGEAVKRAIQTLGGTQKSSAVQRWVAENYGNKWNERTIYQHLRGCSVNLPTAIKYHPTFSRFLYSPGIGEFELYSEEKHGCWTANGYREGSTELPPDPIEEIRELSEEIEERGRFAYEAHLRDYLARNLEIIEQGMKLWTGDLNGSIEFPIEGRRIDILAKDVTGLPVILELKLNRGHDRTIGQALFYRGALKKMLNSERVRVILIAAEITEELKIAAAEVSDVTLFTYTLTMQVEKI